MKSEFKIGKLEKLKEINEALNKKLIELETFLFIENGNNDNNSDENQLEIIVDIKQ